MESDLSHTSVNDCALRLRVQCAASSTCYTSRCFTQTRDDRTPIGAHRTIPKIMRKYVEICSHQTALSKAAGSYCRSQSATQGMYTLLGPWYLLYMQCMHGCTDCKIRPFILIMFEDPIQIGDDLYLDDDEILTDGIGRQHDACCTGDASGNNKSGAYYAYVPSTPQ